MASEESWWRYTATGAAGFAGSLLLIYVAFARDTPTRDEMNSQIDQGAAVIRQHVDGLDGRLYEIGKLQSKMDGKLDTLIDLTKRRGSVSE